MHMEYPKWLYQSDGRSTIVNNRDEEEALGEGWADTPAAFMPAAFERKKETKGGKKA